MKMRRPFVMVCGGRAIITDLTKKEKNMKPDDEIDQPDDFHAMSLEMQALFREALQRCGYDIAALELEAADKTRETDQEG